MFYVYELIDPRDGQVFYVGKGKGDRYRHHECEAKKGKRGPKCDRIREIWEAGQKVDHNTFSRHKDEDDAYIAEADRIEELGLDNLTNQIPGGVGGYSVGEPPWKPSLDIAVLLIKRTRGFKFGLRAQIAGVWQDLDLKGISDFHLTKVMKPKGVQWLVDHLKGKNIVLEVIENRGLINAV